MFESFSYCNIFIRYDRLCTRVYKRQFLSILRQLMALFMLLAIVFLRKPIYYYNRHFILSRSVFVPTPYNKVSISYVRVIKRV